MIKKFLRILLVFGFIYSFYLSESAQAQVQTGSGTIPAVTGPSGWHSVSFFTPFTSTPVVLASIDIANGQPAAFRIRNVTTTGFEIAVREPAGADGLTPAQDFDYFAGLPGVQTLPDGVTQIEIGQTKLDNIQHGSGVPGVETWADVNFANTLIFGGIRPAVIATIQTTENETTNPGVPSCMWLTEVIQNVTLNDFDLALERSEDPNCSPISAEVIGWMAIEDGATGSFTDSNGDTIYFEGQHSADSVRGWGTCANFAYAGTYTSPPMVFASKNRHDGGDGGWVRTCNNTTTQVGFLIDEDQAQNSERNHTTEAVGYFVWGRSTLEFKKGLHRIERDGQIMPNGITITDNDCVWFELKAEGFGTWYDVWESAGWAFDGVYDNTLTNLITPIMTPSSQDVDGDGDNEAVLTINTSGSFLGYLKLCVDVQ